MKTQTYASFIAELEDEVNSLPANWFSRRLQSVRVADVATEILVRNPQISPAKCVQLADELNAAIYKNISSKNTK